jgi:hypothetical protein
LLNISSSNQYIRISIGELLESSAAISWTLALSQALVGRDEDHTTRQLLILVQSKKTKPLMEQEFPQEAGYSDY